MLCTCLLRRWHFCQPTIPTTQPINQSDAQGFTFQPLPTLSGFPSPAVSGQWSLLYSLSFQAVAHSFLKKYNLFFIIIISHFFFYHQADGAYGIFREPNKLLSSLAWSPFIILLPQLPCNLGPEWQFFRICHFAWLPLS